MNKFQKTRLACALIFSAASASSAWAQADPVVPEASRPFITAPSIKPDILNQPALAAAGYSVKVAVEAAPAAAVVDSQGRPDDNRDELNFLIAPNQLPLPLRYAAPALAANLAFSIPTPSEVKLLLPGASLDAADEGRYRISQYMGDATGGAAKFRDRQKADVQLWGTSTKTMAKQLTKNPWQIYQFNRVVRATLIEFQAGVKAQTLRDADQMALQVKPILEQVAIVMPEMPTQQAKQAWYNLMVQLKDNFMLYQAQMISGDSLTLTELNVLLNTYPEIPRPAGEAPTLKSPNGTVNPSASNTPQVNISSEAPEAKASAPKPSGKESNPYGGVVILLVMVLSIGFLILKARKKSGSRNSKQD